MSKLPASTIASVQLPVIDFRTPENDPITIFFDDVVRLP